ncbi:hypothetical protein J7L67_02795 [bacterium]|nr:hypothetical protein [bacterium]
MIFVCHESNIKKFLSVNKNKISYGQWIYLGTEYRKISFIAEKILSGSYKNVNYLFDKISKKLKNDFIELAASFVSEKSGLSWWTSNLSHKSGYTCGLLRDFILFFVFEEIVNSVYDKNMLVVVQSLPLYNVLYENFRRKINFYGQKEKVEKEGFCEIAQKRFSYVAQTIRRKAGSAHKAPDSPITLVMAWLNNSIAKKDNPFNVYYGGLPEFFQSASMDAMYLGYIWDYENYFKVKQNISARYRNVVFPEDYLTRADIFKSAFLPVLRQINLGKVIFSEYDLTSLFENYISDELANTHNSMCLSFYYVFKNLKRAGFKIEKFIYPFENQPWEKACVQGIRKFYPDCKIIAFKHTTVPQFMLAHFPSEREFISMPVPDKIVCCGKSSYNALYPYWSDKCRLENGPALRHSYLFKKDKLADKKNNDNKNVGAALSINIDENIEFLDVIIKTAKQVDIDFLVKFHPAVNNKILINQLKSANLNNVSVFEGSPDEFLKEICVMLFTATDLSVQAALSGIPVICYMPMAKLDMNPVNDKFIYTKVYGESSLCCAVKQALADKDKNLTVPSVTDYYNRTEKSSLLCFVN